MKYAFRIGSNYDDTPEELYERLKINIELNEKLDLRIFSFPMKYIPINSKDRNYIDNKPGHWNRKYLRTVQAILNVVHGAVMPKRKFFEKAFGRNIKEFKELLLMPEDYVYYRYYAEELGLMDQWRKIYGKLSNSLNGELSQIINFIGKNSFTNIEEYSSNDLTYKFLEHYKNRIKLKDYKQWKKNKIY